MPIGLSEVCAMYFQLCVITSPLMPPGRVMVCSRAAMPLQPPAFITAMIASGEKPITIRKNCSTSL